MWIHISVVMSVLVSAQVMDVVIIIICRLIIVIILMVMIVVTVWVSTFP